MINLVVLLHDYFGGGLRKKKKLKTPKKLWNNAGKNISRSLSFSGRSHGENLWTAEHRVFHVIKGTVQTFVLRTLWFFLCESSLGNINILMSTDKLRRLKGRWSTTSVARSRADLILSFPQLEMEWLFLRCLLDIYWGTRQTLTLWDYIKYLYHAHFRPREALRKATLCAIWGMLSMLWGGLSGLSSWPTNSMIYDELQTVVLRAVGVGNSHQQARSKES